MDEDVVNTFQLLTILLKKATVLSIKTWRNIMRDKKRVIVTFLSKSTLETVDEDLRNLIAQIDAGIPQFKDLQIILVTSMSISVSKKIQHPRIRAVVCGEYFSPKNNFEYILLENNPPKECKRALKKMKSVEVYAIMKNGEIKKIAA